MNVLDAINRIFRSNGIVRGDDDDITTLEDTAHNATIQLCLIAIQDELNDLVSDNVIAYEVTAGTIATTASTRTYAVADDFIRFFGTPSFYNAVANRPIYEWPGGRDSLKNQIYTYDTQPGEPNWWYFEPTTTKRVAFYPVPNSVFTYTYDYERDVSVYVATDVLPFHNEPEAQAFTQAAGRRFLALKAGATDVTAYINKDPTYTSARSRLMGLSKGRNPYTRYGALYR